MDIWVWAVAALVFGAGVAANAQAQQSDSESPTLRVVFFTPSDVEPPDGVQERLKEYVDYAQAFYSKWMGDGLGRLIFLVGFVLCWDNKKGGNLFSVGVVGCRHVTK